LISWTVGISGQRLILSSVDAEQVREFHTKALEAGGKDNGAPGPRPHYGPNYYAAFVRDPACGINFEVICRNGDD